MNPTSITATTQTDEGYDTFERLIRDRVAAASGPLFTTMANGAVSLFDVYLGLLPEDRRQHYNCRRCRQFFDRYGDLVRIDPVTGLSASLLWDVQGVPDFFKAAVSVLKQKTERARVSGVFYCSDEVWGTPTNHDNKRNVDWTHLSGAPPAALVFKSIYTAEQMAAEKKQDYINLKLALNDYGPACASEAARVLDANVLDRSEKTGSIAKWFRDAHERVGYKNGPAKDNMLWYLAATAPPGCCHIRSSMIGTLMDDIKAGLSYGEVSRRWNAKMHPLRYQRPTTVKEGNIQQAEKLVAQMGVEKSLARRFARLSDVLTFTWLPNQSDPSPQEGTPAGGIFGHLRRDKKAPSLELPPIPMSWVKFAMEVLPGAAFLHYRTKSEWEHDSYFGLVTAVDPGAPPILQWDGLDGKARNPVSWYFYSNGSMAGTWGLPFRDWVEVSAVFSNPAHWQDTDKFGHVRAAAFLALKGAVDRADGGRGFFVESLKSQLHPIRSVLEAHDEKAELAGREEGNANGIAIQAGPNDCLYELRVTTASGLVQEYRITRWE